VLGIPATFLNEGLRGVVADPFGSSMCLILVGLFFAAPLYRMNLLTIGDFYKKRYGRASRCSPRMAIVISYLGWVGAQITALGLVFNVVSGGEISQVAGMWIGSLTILVYTLFGGMWAVAVTDFLQMIIIVIGMLWIGNEVSGMAGGVGVVVNHAMNERASSPSSRRPILKEVIAFIAAAMTMMLGSFPSRTSSSACSRPSPRRSPSGVRCSAAALYFASPSCRCSWPTRHPDRSGHGVAPDQHRLPDDPARRWCCQHAPLVAQILFFGALLSASRAAPRPRCWRRR
jgi:SSS family solute:Na+ symporter